MTCLSSLSLAAAPAVPVGSDPAAQLNQTRTYLEQQQRLAQLQADRDRDRSAVESNLETEEKGKQADVTFVLKKVDFDTSAVLTQAELAGLAKDYIGKTTDLGGLYGLVNKINALYKDKGYVVCRAYLPPQTIHDGAVYIHLVEGRTGNVTVTGNKSTRTGYVRGRLPLKAGDVSNLNELSRSVLWFNGTNDAQLRIKLQAGAKEGTTDHVISVYEPPRERGYVLFDTAGSASTGIWREGAGWYTRSLTGNRDPLNLYLMRSEGTKSGSISYSIPFTKSGTRFGMQYSANSVHIRHGSLEDLDVRGHSTLYGFSLTQPLQISQKSRVEAALEWNKQNSRTDFLNNPWIDDRISRWTGSLTATRYSEQNIWYQRHAYSIGTWDNMDSSQKHYGKYNIDFLAQHLFANRHLFTARLAGQLSSSHYLPSADQFYIGGVNSVRGYKENILSGDSGYSLNLEYAIPAQANTEWFAFLDMGSVYGDSAFDDHCLMGAGLGYRLHLTNKVNASLALGIPFKTDLNHEEQGHYRVHFAFYGEF